MARMTNGNSYTKVVISELRYGYRYKYQLGRRLKVTTAAMEIKHQILIKIRLHGHFIDSIVLL